MSNHQLEAVRVRTFVEAIGQGLRIRGKSPTEKEAEQIALDAALVTKKAMAVYEKEFPTKDAPAEEKKAEEKSPT
jgi:hypothetical protein